MLRALSVLLLLVACREQPSSDDTGPTGDDTGPTGDDTGSTGDTGPTGDDTGVFGDDTGNVSTARLDHVVTSLAVVTTGEGFDLDGDSVVDNALLPLAGILNPLMATELASSEVVLVLQTSGLDGDLTSAATIALVHANDTDGDATDNFSGFENFSGGDLVDEAGVALSGTPTALTDGDYTTTLSNTSVKVGDYLLRASMPLHVTGHVELDGHSGIFGVAAKMSSIVQALEEAGLSEAVTYVEGLADIDADEDGIPESISMVLAFDSVACVLQK